MRRTSTPVAVFRGSLLAYSGSSTALGYANLHGWRPYGNAVKNPAIDRFREQYAANG
jgi:hypothetical protein